MYNASFSQSFISSGPESEKNSQCSGSERKLWLSAWSDSKLLKQFFEMFIAKSGTVFLTAFTVLKLLVSF